MTVNQIITLINQQIIPNPKNSNNLLTKNKKSNKRKK